MDGQPRTLQSRLDMSDGSGETDGSGHHHRYNQAEDEGSDESQVAPEQGQQVDHGDHQGSSDEELVHIAQRPA